MLFSREIKILPLFLALLVSGSPTVNLQDTQVVGTVSSTAQNVELFAGIPYARPPLGQFRFVPAVLQPEPQGPVFDASSFGPACLQLRQDPGLPKISEDCLSLNVFRPAGTSSNAALPVMVWIHGGSFVFGGSSIYDGSLLVAQSVLRGTPTIFVSINYRLGPFGFPQGIEGANRKSLNLGLRDQLVALNWLQRNIEAFGGDKTKVTAIGESAGAISIDIHMLGPFVKGERLARAAILQSSASGSIYGPLHSQGSWQSFVSGVPECASLANTSHTFSCLQGIKDSNVLLRAWGLAAVFSFPPDIDGLGGLVVDLPSRITQLSPLPVLMGSNLDEGTIFTPQGINSTEQIRSVIINGSTPSGRSAEVLADAADKILQLYPDVPAHGSPFGTGKETFGLNSQYKRFAAITADFIFEWHRRTLARMMSGKAKVPVYAYKFSDPEATNPLVDIIGTPGSFGVCHASEIAYVFGATAAGNSTSPLAKNLSLRMMDYWISFVVSLDPNDGKGTPRPVWERYTPANEAVIQLRGDDTKMIPDTYRREQIAFISKDPVVFHR